MQGTQSLRKSVVGLWDGSYIASKDRSCGALSVGGITLATAATARKVRSVDFDDDHTAGLEDLRQTCTVRTSAFDASTAEHSEFLRPLEQLLAAM